MRGRPHPVSTTRRSTAGGSRSREQTSRACASAASSDDAGLRALLVGGDDQVRQALQDLDGELRAIPDERSEEHTSELQSQSNLVCRLLLEKKKKDITEPHTGATLDIAVVD